MARVGGARAVPTMQLEPFRRRLETAINYIDMHLEMCTTDATQGEVSRTLGELEQRFYVLLSDAEVRHTPLGQAPGGQARRGADG
jgi:hypothetical protein